VERHSLRVIAVSLAAERSVDVKTVNHAPKPLTAYQ
jgi:hypothetical protein